MPSQTDDGGPAAPERNKADDVCKLLDSDAYVVLYKNGLNTYSAVCLRSDEDRMAVQNVIDDLPDDGPHITDDMLPSRVLYRLTEKATTGRIVDGRIE